MSKNDFQTASDLVNSGKYSEAAELLLPLRENSDTTLAACCDYLLAAALNGLGDALTAYDLYYNAFSEKNDVASYLYADDSPNKNFIFTGKKKEMELDCCPLCCNKDTQPIWCYPLTEAGKLNEAFNPIRLWMYCEPCHHIYARYFPEKLFLYNDKPRAPDPFYFNYYATVLDRISRYAAGMDLFEVGIGACECLLAAHEIGFNAFGIDVIDSHVKMAREKFGLDAQTADFVEFRSDKKFDIIIMGDVIEHVSDPIAAMQNAYNLLRDDGALWVSTPNFDSAYSIVTGHNDPLRKQQFHLNYFSRVSFYSLLNKCGFAPVDYNISNHYNGSMEVIAVKTSQLQNA